jgi:ABC-type multidrug transport system permease subunit
LADVARFLHARLYYLNPFTRLLGGLLVFPIWDVQVQCEMNEMAIFNPPAGSTCGDYLQAYLANSPPGYLDNPVRARPIVAAARLPC